MVADAHKARWRHVPAITWTTACAFGGASIDRMRGQSGQIRTDNVPQGVKALRWLGAVIVLPAIFLVVVIGQFQGALYAGSDQRSSVLVKPVSMAKDLKATVICVGSFILALSLLTILTVALCVAFDWRAVLLAISAWAVWVYVGLFGWLLLSALLTMASLTEGGWSPIGDETPDGLERWSVDALAARTAADGAAAIRLAQRVVLSLPPGVLVVTAAINPERLNGYVRLGFTHGAKNRVYKRM